MLFTFINKYFCCCIKKKYYDYSCIDTEWDDIISEIQMNKL